MVFTIIVTAALGLLFVIHAGALIHELYLKSKPGYSRGSRMLQALWGISLIDLALFLIALKAVVHTFS